MRKLLLYMTMSLDGFVAGPNNELDWMSQTPDEEMTRDIVDLMSRADIGLIGYPTGVGMIQYWANAAHDPAASKDERAVAQAINKAHGILLTNTPVKIDLDNAEVLLVQTDDDLIEAVMKLKRQPGGDIGVPGGVRTAQKFVRLSLVDEYIFMVQPVAIGNGKRVFTTRVDLALVSSKTYRSGTSRVCYRPR